MEKVPMTAGGYAALEVELKQRQSVERPRIIEHIAEARSHGDLSENAEYHAAKEEQSHNEGRIAELEDKLARADIIDISKLSGDTIKFGAGVTWSMKTPTRKRYGRSSASRKPMQEGPHLHHLAAGARADRQEEGGVGGSRSPRRRQGLRDHQGRVALAPFNSDFRFRL